MAIKLPKEIIKSGYRCYEVEIPKPVIETEKKDDGSFRLYAKYDASSLDGFAKDIARDMSEKLDAKLIDELLRLNGYVPEKTCRNLSADEDVFICSECQNETHGFMVDKFGCTVGFGKAVVKCPNCGARVKEEE